MNKIAVILSIFTFAIGVGIGAVYAAENIDPDNDGSQYAYGENVGWLNFEPGGDGGNGAEMTDTEVKGYAWAENIGWINLSPTNFGGVVNNGSGMLSGYAWGENVGWINFGPTGGGVTITNGDFDGWAWGENIGWIHFQNSAIPYVVQTSWPDGTLECIPGGLTTRGKCGRSGCKVQLVWTDIGADHYNVYRSTTPGGPYTLIGTTTSIYSTYLDTNVTIGTTYYYVVGPAINGDEICQTNEASATLQARRIRSR